MSTYLSAVAAMIDWFTRYNGNRKHLALHISYGNFTAARVIAQQWPKICKVLPALDFQDVELPLGIYNTVTLHKNGQVTYNYKREWKDLPPQIATILKASTQLDKGCLDILSAAGISVPEPIVDIPRPTLVDKAFNLADAMVGWVKSGFKIAPEEQYKARKAVCLACDQWNGEGYFGAGACRACGCTGAKLYIASSECPLKKWS